MLKLFSTLLLIFGMLFLKAQDKPDHVPGQLIVMLQPGERLEKFIGRNTFSNGNVTGIKLNEVLSGSMNIFLIDFDAGIGEEKFLQHIKAAGGVAIAQFNHYTQSRAITPGDALFSGQWALNNTGQSSGTIDADIDAPEAWDITTGGLTATGDTIVVAVIDAGFQLTHIDLDFWKNYNEIPGNSIDDDGNGYKDDVNGWNAINNNGSLVSDAHGTHCAGIIGARGNNSIGTSGVNWNVKIMGVVGSTTLESKAVIAYSYVKDNRRLYNQTNGAKGAFVVATNSSFGVDKGKPANFPLWCAMYDSLGAVGILSIGATANNNYDVDTAGDIPTACPSPWLISVTNTTNTDTKYSPAAWGDTTIDIGAPGTTIYSTVPTNTWAQSGWIGTSMASPHVAGAVALMYAAACPQFIADYKADPSGKAQLMSDYLLTAADVVPSMTGKTTSNGRLNLKNALLNVQSYSVCGTAIAELSFSLNKNEMKNIYPNPSGNWVELEYSSLVDNFNVVVKNVFGQVVKTFQRTNHKGLNKHKIDVADLADGIYFVGIENEMCKSNFVKLIKTGEE